MSQVFVYPRATEKAYTASQDNVYVFNVPVTATKRDIVESVEKQFDVKVVNIKTLIQNGKAVRYNRGARRYPGTTNRKDTKKAYVTLAAGDKIQVFAEEAKEEKK